MSDAANTSPVNQSNDFTPEQLEITERSSLKDRAVIMGIEFQDNIPTNKLRELVDAKMQEKVTDAAKATQPSLQKPTATVTTQVEPEAVIDPLVLIRKQALKLVRINASPMNPALANRDGIIISVGNSHVPTQKKFVKFATPEGYHVPNIIYEHLLEMKYLRVTKKTNSKGQEIILSEQMPAFNIQVLPELTADEIRAMRIAQQASKSGV